MHDDDLADEAPGGKGHNLPPAMRHDAELDAIRVEAEPYLTSAAITDDDTAAAVEALVTRIAEAKKAAEADKETEYRPHKSAADAVVEAYKPVLAKADKLLSTGKALLTGWAQHKRKLHAQAVEAARLEAERKAEEARKALQASGGDLEARDAAEALVEEAKTHEIAAKAVAKMSVAPKIAGRALRMRKVCRAEVTDIDAAIGWAWENHFDAVWRELKPIIEALAERHVRDAKRDIGKHKLPGIVVTVTEEGY